MRPLAVFTALLLFAVGCRGSDAADTSTTGDPATTDPATTDLAITDPATTDPASTPSASTEPPATDAATTEPPVSEPGTQEPGIEEPGIEQPGIDALLVDPFELVEELAGDDLNGRNNLTDGSAAARRLLLEALVGVVEPARPDVGGEEGYLQPYDLGTNIVGILPGYGTLAEEYVLVGAHYDHLGPGECRARDATDDVICNGAADNAAGVGAVISIINTIRYGDVQRSGGESPGDDDPGRRSIIVGLWDGEEDGLIGSQVYVENPLVPLEQTVAYVNFDIQGAQLTPALADTTILVGAETGGAALVDAAQRASDASPLDYALFSLVFGQGRSDHANLVAAGVPSVFFTDANNGCYHSVLDDIDHVDRDKFYLQVGTAQALVDDLVTTPTPPAYVADAPLSTYDDAAALLEVVARAEPDFGALPGDAPTTSAQFLVDLQAIVDAGPDAYDDAAGGVVLSGAGALVDALAESECTLPV